MVVRVDREIFDPVGAGVQSGGVGGVSDDGSRPLPWQPRPFQSKTEYIVSEGMRLMGVPSEVLRQTLNPFAMNDPFPPTMGYDHTPLTIEEVLDTDRWSPQIRSWMSGNARKPRRVDSVEDNWSGTLRGFNSSPNMAG